MSEINVFCFIVGTVCFCTLLLLIPIALDEILKRRFYDRCEKEGNERKLLYLERMEKAISLGADPIPWKKVYEENEWTFRG